MCLMMHFVHSGVVFTDSSGLVCWRNPWEYIHLFAYIVFGNRVFGVKESEILMGYH